MCCDQGQGQVIDLDPSDFDTQVASGEWLLAFTAPWCGYCRRLEPIYQDVAETLKATSVKVAKVDASTHKGEFDGCVACLLASTMALGPITFGGQQDSCCVLFSSTTAPRRFLSRFENSIADCLY